MTPFVKRLAFVILFLTPLILSAGYMWSMWDPTKYLPEVRLAVVNEDEGEFGGSVVEGLMETEYLAFEETSETEAHDGLLRGDYLFTVSIPPNFSEDIQTVIDPEPVSPTVTIAYNDFNGTNGTVLTSGVVPQVQTAVAEGIQKGYATQVLEGLNALGEGLGAAHDGAIQLNDGAGQLDEGADQILDGAVQLNDGAGQLDDGAGQLSDGTAAALDGSAQLVDGQQQLAAGLNQFETEALGQLADGALQIDEGVQQLTGLLIPLLEQAQAAAPGLQAAADALRTLGRAEEAARIEGIAAQLGGSVVSDLNRLRDGTAQLSGELNDPNSALMTGWAQIQDGSGQLVDGQNQLHDGLIQLDDGANQLKDGTVQLYEGTGQLYDGGLALKDGTTQLKDGTETMETSLADGVAQAPHVEDIEASSNQVAVPISYGEEHHNAVQLVVDEADPTIKSIEGGVSILLVLVFGFLLMAIFSILLPHVLGKRRLHTAVGPTIQGYAVSFGANTAILALLAAVSAAFGWRPSSWLAMILVIVVIAAMGTALFQMLRIAFGRIFGGIVALGTVAYGIFSFGAVWPIQLTPGLFKALHNLHPMTYARDAFVRANDGIFDSTFWIAIVVMFAFIALSLLISFLVRRSRVNSEKEAVDTLVTT